MIGKDGVDHDRYCEENSEACGCESRTNLTKIIEELRIRLNMYCMKEFNRYGGSEQHKETIELLNKTDPDRIVT